MRQEIIDPGAKSDLPNYLLPKKRKKTKWTTAFALFLKRALTEFLLRPKLRRFERIYRWYNCADIKIGMKARIEGKLMPIGQHNLATLGRVVMATKKWSDPLDIFQVLTKPSSDYRAFFFEGTNMESSDPLVEDLQRAVKDPIYDYIFYSKHIRTGVVDEVSLVLNNEPLRDAVNTFREGAIEKVSFPYWNTLRTALHATRALQKGRMYEIIWPTLIGTFLTGFLYGGLDSEAWDSRASGEDGETTVHEQIEAVRVGHLEHVGWMYEDLSDKKLVTEIIEYSMFYLGKARKEIPKDYKRPREPAQIVALAATYDAAVHPRPYRDAISMDEIVKQISDEFYSGWKVSADGTVTDRGKFDPEIIKSFQETVAPTTHRLGG